jgi:hypothetical protein
MHEFFLWREGKLSLIRANRVHEGDSVEFARLSDTGGPSEFSRSTRWWYEAMDPVSVLSVASAYLRVIDTFSSIYHDTPSWNAVKYTLAELKGLNAVLREAMDVLNELGPTVPKSAQIIVDQCFDTGRELNQLAEGLERYKTDHPSRRKSLKQTLYWHQHHERISMLLDLFRQNCLLLRQIAAE